MRLDMIGIITNDIARSLQFYRLLGIEVPESAENDYIETTLPNGLRLSWNTLEVIRSYNPGFHYEADAPQRCELAFRCDSPQEVDAQFSRVTAAGFEGEKDPFDAPWGQRYAEIADPDGLIIALFAPLPQE